MKISLLISTVFFLSMFLPYISVKAADSSKEIVEMNDLVVSINGKQVLFDVPPIIKNGRTLVPLRAIFEEMGAEVTWNPKSYTVQAHKNGTTITLGINSKIAKINSIVKKQLDVPAMLYRDRTLVPLRFVGEAFGGTVDWSEQDHTVKIKLVDSDSSSLLESMPVYLNNKLLHFTENKPIVKNDTFYIPMVEFLDNIPGDVYWSRNLDTLQTQVDGKIVNLYIGQNYISVDGKTVEISEAPIEADGMIYASLNTIVKHYGVQSYYVANDKEIKIYITREKFKHPFLQKETITFSEPTNVVDTQFVGNRRIMVSDNPENLNARTVPEVYATLWHDDVQAEKSALDHRIFGWHINEFKQNVHIGITIENLSTTNELEIVDLKGAHRKSPNTWVNYDVGLPLAEYVLSDTMTNVNLKNSTVKQGETVLLNSFELQSKYTIGFSYDFTVKKKSGTGELKYRIRTVLSKNNIDLTTIHDDPVNIDETARHPRGIWSGSQLETELPPYEAGSDDISFQISNGRTDNLMSVENGIGDQTQMIRNPGHFGASYIVKIPIENNTGERKTVRVRFGARGGIYNAAIKYNGKVFLTPTLTPMTEVVNVVDYEAVSSKGLIELEIMHAGGSALPLAIELVTLE